MNRKLDYVSQGNGSFEEGDREVVIDLLYEEVERRWTNEEPFEGLVGIIKYARVELGQGLLEAKRLTDDMRLKYSQNMRDMGL